MHMYLSIFISNIHLKYIYIYVPNIYIWNKYLWNRLLKEWGNWVREIGHWILIPYYYLKETFPFLWLISRVRHKIVFPNSYLWLIYYVISIHNILQTMEEGRTEDNGLRRGGGGRDWVWLKRAIWSRQMVMEIFWILIIWVLVSQSCPTLCGPMTVACQARLSINSPGKNTGVVSHSLLHGVFLTWDPT